MCRQRSGSRRVSETIREYAPRDIREIAHNQAIRALPANGTEVETDRLYFGDDAAWDEEIYVCIQDKILTADDRPELGADWQTYFEKVTTRVIQVTALPAPSAVTDRNLGKLHAVRSAHDGAVSMLAHIAAVDDATVGEFTAEHDGAMVGYWGSRGHLTGYLNIERLDEVDGGSGTKQVVMLVTDGGTIPSENTPRGIYFRETGTTGNWRSIAVTAGADDEYESLAYVDTITLFDEHTTYDLVVTSDGTGEGTGHEFASPPADDRYDFFPDSRKWSIMAERDDLDRAQVFIREFVRDPMIPDAPTGTGDADRRLLLGGSGAYSLHSEIPDAMIPASVMRDAEFTASAVRTLLGLTTAEVNDLLTGASLAGQVLTFTQNDGTSIALTIPEGGDTDGVVSEAAFDDDGTTLTLTIDTDGVETTIAVSVPDVLRGLTSGVATQGDPVTFYASMESVDDVQADGFGDPIADLEFMEILNEDIAINQGGFTVETTDNVSSVVVPFDGLYIVSVHMTFRGSSGRTVPRGRLKRTRGSDDTFGTIGTGGYLRGSGTFGGDICSLDFAQPLVLQADDKITVQVTNQANNEIDLVGAESSFYMLKEEGALSINDGFVVTVEDGPPTASEDTIKNIYRTKHNPPKMWVGYQPHEATTPASADSTLITAGANGTGYRGVAYSAPFPATNGDWFWDRSGHSWEYRSGGQFFHVSFTELKTQAMNSAGDALFFGADDVFLSEVFTVAEAAGIIDNAGGVVADRKYWAIVAGTFREITDFVAAVGATDLYDFIEISDLVAPLYPANDDSLTAPTGSLWVETSVDKPNGTWGFIRPVGFTDEYLTFYVPELDAVTEGSAGGAAAAAERLAFPFGENELFLGYNSDGKLLVSTNAPDEFWPSEIIVRTN